MFLCCSGFWCFPKVFGFSDFLLFFWVPSLDLYKEFWDFVFLGFSHGFGVFGFSRGRWTSTKKLFFVCLCFFVFPRCLGFWDFPVAAGPLQRILFLFWFCRFFGFPRVCALLGNCPIHLFGLGFHRKDVHVSGSEHSNCVVFTIRSAPVCKTYAFP